MVTACSLIKPPEMVFATSVERNAPIRFNVPAAITAVFGFRAPVAIEVVMEAIREVERKRNYNYEPYDDKSSDIHAILFPPSNGSAFLLRQE